VGQGSNYRHSKLVFCLLHCYYHITFSQCQCLYMRRRIYQASIESALQYVPVIPVWFAGYSPQNPPKNVEFVFHGTRSVQHCCARPAGQCALTPNATVKSKRASENMEKRAKLILLWVLLTKSERIYALVGKYTPYLHSHGGQGLAKLARLTWMDKWFIHEHITNRHCWQLTVPGLFQVLSDPLERIRK
jgi:hypothetical protein